MRYRIEYADGRCCNFANGRADLLEWLKLLEEEEIADIRKVYKKSGVSVSVPVTDRSYIRSADGGALMGTDIEKLIDLMIQERMQNQFAKWRKAETDKEKKADYLHLETEYEKAISALSEEQKEAVRHYCDSIFDSGTESECFFYRLGLKDGIRLWKFMKKLMKTVS